MGRPTRGITSLWFGWCKCYNLVHVILSFWSLLTNNACHMQRSTVISCGCQMYKNQVLKSIQGNVSRNPLIPLWHIFYNLGENLRSCSAMYRKFFQQHFKSCFLFWKKQEIKMKQLLRLNWAWCSFTARHEHSIVLWQLWTITSVGHIILKNIECMQNK